VPEGHNWRAINVNFTCTGNVTFPLPPGVRLGLAAV